MKKLLQIRIWMAAWMMMVSSAIAAHVASHNVADANLAETAESIRTDVEISASGRVVRIIGANGQVLRIYNVLGAFVAQHKVQGDDFKIEIVGTPGIYIVKVGQVSRRIIINDK